MTASFVLPGEYNNTWDRVWQHPVYLFDKMKSWWIPNQTEKTLKQKHDIHTHGRRVKGTVVGEIDDRKNEEWQTTTEMRCTLEGTTRTHANDGWEEEWKVIQRGVMSSCQLQIENKTKNTSNSLAHLPRITLLISCVHYISILYNSESIHILFANPNKDFVLIFFSFFSLNKYFFFIPFWGRSIIWLIKTQTTSC